jgi:hypothetical protein
MEKLGIYTQTFVTTSTSPITFEIFVVNGGGLTAGELFINGLSTDYDSFHQYYKFIGIGDDPQDIFSNGNCLIYNEGNLNPTIGDILFEPIDSSYVIKIDLTPNSSVNTKWNLYYKDLSYSIL